MGTNLLFQFHAVLFSWFLLWRHKLGCTNADQTIRSQCNPWILSECNCGAILYYFLNRRMNDFFCCLWNVWSSMLCLFDTYIAFTPTILEKTSPTIKIREQGVTLNESLLALNIVERSRPALCDHAHLFYLDFNVYRSFVISWGPIMDPSKDAYRQSVRFNCIPQFYSVNRYNFVKKIIEKMLDYIYI